MNGHQNSHIHSPQCQRHSPQYYQHHLPSPRSQFAYTYRAVPDAPTTKIEDEVPSRRPSSAPGNRNLNDAATIKSRQKKSAAAATAARQRASDQQQAAKGLNGDDSSDADASELIVRSGKPPLLRSRSEHGLRLQESDDVEEDPIDDHGPRHGFEDHYESQEFVSQLANVSLSFPLASPFLRLLVSWVGWLDLAARMK